MLTPASVSRAARRPHATFAPPPARSAATTARPTITIGLPVHNGAAHLHRALRAALTADRDDLEVVVSDNASTDDTADIVRTYAETDARVRYEPTERLLPVMANFNRTLALGRGTWFHWASHDDWIDPDFVSRTLALAEPGVAAVAAGVRSVDADGNVFAVTTPRMPGSDAVSAARRVHAVLWRLPGGSVIAHGLLHRETAERIGGLANIEGASIALAVRLAAVGRIVTIDAPLAWKYLGPEHAARDHWTWLDPRNRDRRPLTSPRLLLDHARAVGDLPAPQRWVLRADALAALVLRRGTAKADIVRRRLLGLPPRPTL